MAFLSFIEWLVDQLWGTPLIVLVLGSGVFFTVMSGFFQFLSFPHVISQTFGRLFKKSVAEAEKASGVKGTLKPFQTLAIAVGAVVGPGNIGGVASAIAIGGPGAVFWMWIAGLTGQIIKMVEVTLAVHYRSVHEDGSTYGGPTYYIKKGIGRDMGWKKIGSALSVLFWLAFMVSYLFNIENYTVSEAIATTFNWNMLAVSAVYVACIYLIIWRDIKKIGEIAGLLVPFMCVFYIASSLFIILKDASAIPNTFKLIFQGAFTGTAAVGGFTGAVFARVIQTGLARSVYSNEAGWGSSPMIHATATTDHPIKQGVLGVFEVFMDTIVICSLTSLVVVNSGEWSSGLDGASLTLSVFTHGVGFWGRITLLVGLALFGLTTSIGLYMQFGTLLQYAAGDSPERQKMAALFNKCFYPLPGMLLLFYAYKFNLPPYKVWMFIDLSLGIPIFINLIAILLLTPKFLSLLKDYRARYMGIGKVDPNFKVFSDDK
ncbi:MAG: amino acid carrier protein [Synergistaceae bacterium]|nr:amino acid carrier protein [Synergistaceae bacterium]